MTHPSRAIGIPSEPDAAPALQALGAAGLTLAVAESLTGGLLAAAIVAVPGASTVFRGGVVSYATDLKASVLGVDAALLADGGPVQAEVALQMADGVRRVLGADVGVATTGVAGPGPADGHEAGTVFVAVHAGTGVAVRELHLAGDRRQIRTATVVTALELLRETMVGTTNETLSAPPSRFPEDPHANQDRDKVTR